MNIREAYLYDVAHPSVEHSKIARTVCNKFNNKTVFHQIKHHQSSWHLVIKQSNKADLLRSSQPQNLSPPRMRF